MDEVEPIESVQEAKWKRFEKLVCEIQKSFTGTTATVTHEDYILGVDSKVEREIDISIKQRVAQFPILVVIDCKDYAVPVNVKSIEEFAGLVEDVRANKGVMVASNGFTPAAVSVAKNKGIDTLCLIDSKGVDWKTFVTVPLLIEDTSIEQYSLTVSGVGRSILPYAPEELVELPMQADDGTSLGTPLKVMHRKWNKEQIPHEPGIHDVGLGKQVSVEYDGVKSKIDITAHVVVKRNFYLGPLQVYTQGFHDAQTGSLITKELRTDSINAGAIARGEVPGWKRLDVTDGSTVRAMMRLAVSSAYGDEDDFEDETSAEPDPPNRQRQ
jgi:hypothetical protein